MRMILCLYHRKQCNVLRTPGTNFLNSCVSSVHHGSQIKNILLLSSVQRTYCLELVLRKPSTVRIGKRGTFVFRAGYYIYVGSARKNIQQRIARHLRTKKKQFWHIDYLLPYAHIKAVWVSSLSEQRIVALLARDLESPVAKFGASDTTNVSHLFFSRKKLSHTRYPLSLLTHTKKRL